jgi:hypothetical protein
MPRLQLSTLALLSLTAIPATAAGGPARDLTPYLIADRATEVALARTAAPHEISDAAAVLVLTATGYVEAAAGTNEFTCLVVRSFEGGFDDVASWWNPKIRAPHCLNAPAAKTILAEMKLRASLVTSGVSEAQIAERVKQAYAQHEIEPPASGAMAYMLSHDQYLGEKDPHWMPHVMFYFGGFRKGAEWGAGGSAQPVVDGGTDPVTGVNVVFIPVARYSDGTPSTGHPGH